MSRFAAGALLVSAGTAFAQVPMPFTETFDSDNAGWQEGPGNPASWSAGAITSQTVDAATDFIAPFPGAPAFTTIFRTQTGTATSGGAFNGNYLAGGIAEL